ncbi:uncharacterized protein LOC117576695 [Drosophila albomicans]|uniref:Uncharacterized protein LOC117576695 n=1 Tax=Drosophila albomicans TaxID=7291 RepID=A0A6P8ZF59_DROAB|nr:uncharacterized protein LOC117576695 [Drosophila albomicans]
MDPLKQNYTYDVILRKAQLPRPEDGDGDEVDRTFSVRVFNEFVDLTANRILTEHFPCKFLGELVASPCDLIGSLSSKGICVTVYDNQEILGSGNAMLSNSLLRKLVNQTFKVNEVVSVDITKDKKTIGTLELNVKLASADPDLDTRLHHFGCYDICRPLDKSVNPRDVVFTLGRSNRCAATTCITDERLMSGAGAPFNCMHEKGGPKEQCGCFIAGVKPPPALDQSKEREQKLLKKLLTDLDIDREHIPTPPSGHTQSRQQKCQCRKSSDSSYFSPMEFWSDVLDTDDDDDEVDEEAESPDVGLLPHQLQELAAKRKKALGVCPTIPTPELTNVKYKPPNLCPVCNANITWLPKVAACPYCGYKRFDMDKPSEEPFDETATAAEVLRNHFMQTRFADGDNQRKHSTCASSDPKVESPIAGKVPKECSCSSLRVCTRCRIKELCEQMFHMDIKSKTPKLPASSPATTKGAKEKTSTPSMRREQLVNIFTEMRDNYAGKEGKEQTAEQLCAAKGKSGKAGKTGAKSGGKSSKAGGKKRTSPAVKKLLKELDQSMPSKPKKKKKAKRRSRSKRYTFLESKPPVKPVTTHQCCARGKGRVPCNMGWMWTANELARHRCWKPGAITKPIRELMSYFLRDYPVDVIGTSRRHCGKRKPGQSDDVSQTEEEPLVQHPTLHIVKKHDEYIITLRPLKDPKTLSVAANPYANMKPVVFRIVKDPVAAGEREMKMTLQDNGFPVCTCNQPIANCFCRSHNDKLIVEQAVRSLAAERGWKDITGSFVYNDLSDSDSDNELDFGVTPPAGVIKPERMRQPDRAHCETQYDPNDWAMPTMFPHPPSALVQYGGCVVGERKGRFPWIMGKGFVHREQKPAKKINQPKKEKKSKGRQKGGYDAGNFQENYLPFHRNWHKSNAPRKTPMTYDNGPLR